MNKSKVSVALIHALKEQRYFFSKEFNEDSFTQLSELLTDGQKTAWGVTKFALGFIFDEDLDDPSSSYANVDKDAFNRDLKSVDDLHSGLITSYSYQAGSLSIATLLDADHMSDSEILDFFKNFDDLIVNVLRKHTGRLSTGTDGATYGTVFFLFDDSHKVQKFNEKLLKKCYESHFMKMAYASAVSVDCQSRTLTRGKGALGMKWKGGIDYSKIEKILDEVV